MAREGKEQINLWLDSELLDEADRRSGLLDKSRSEYLRDLIREDTTFRTQEEVEEQVERLKAKKRDYQEKAEEVEEKIERFQSKLEKYQQRRDDYREEFEKLVEDVQERPNILKHADKRLERVAKAGGITKARLKDEVLEEIGADDVDDIEPKEESIIEKVQEEGGGGDA